MDESTVQPPTARRARATAPKPLHRRAGEGSVYRRKDRPGTWRGSLAWTENGVQRRRSVDGSSAADVRAKLDEIRADVGAGVAVPAGRQVTVGAYLADWIERDAARVRPSTWRVRETHVRCYLLPTLGSIVLRKLSATDVERAMARWMKSGRPTSEGDRRRGRQKHLPASSQTVRHVRATLRRALTGAARDGLVTRNAASGAQPPRLEHREIEYLSAEEVGRLLEAVAEMPVRPLYVTAVATGLRLGELLGLAWADVDFAGGTLRVRRSLGVKAGGGWELGSPKSAKSRRTVPLAPIALDALRAQKVRQAAVRLAAGPDWEDQDLVFADVLGRPLSPGQVSHQFGKDLGLAGLAERITFHGLRHSAATLLLSQGIPISTISELLGHTSIGVTASFYAAIAPVLRLEARDAMARALAGH